MSMNDIDLFTDQNFAEERHVEPKNQRRQRTLVVELILRDVVHLQAIRQVSHSFTVSIAMCNQNHLNRRQYKVRKGIISIPSFQSALHALQTRKNKIK